MVMQRAESHNVTNQHNLQQKMKQGDSSTPFNPIVNNKRETVKFLQIRVNSKLPPLASQLPGKDPQIQEPPSPYFGIQQQQDCPDSRPP